MLINKIDGRYHKSLTSLTLYLKRFNLSLIDYYIKYENFKIPKCHCGKDSKYNRGLDFYLTCGDKKCISFLHSSKKHSEETKEVMRKKRFNFLKKKTGKTAWERRNSGEMSYLEKWYHDLCVFHKIYNKYDVINEFSVYPYFIDYAFINEKVAIELDGACHFSKNKRLEHDFKKDDFLIDKGWWIFRIRYDEISDSKFFESIDFIGNNKVKNYDSKLYSYFEVKENKKAKLKELKNQKINEDINNKINLILNSNINFNKFGWVKKVGDLIGCEAQNVNRWLKKHMPDFYNKFNNKDLTKNNQDLRKIVFETYNELKSMKRVAKKLDISLSSVIKILKS